MKNLSGRGDISELSVRHRLSVLDDQMSELLPDRATHAATARAERATYATTASDGHMPPPVNVSIRRSDRNVPGHSLHVVDHSIITPGVLSDTRHDITVTVNILNDNATTHMEVPDNRHPARGNTRRMYNHIEDSGNEGAFRTV